MTNKPKNLRISEAARELNVSASSVRRWLAAGLLTGWKMGRVVRVERESLEIFVQAHSYAVNVLGRRKPANSRWWVRGGRRTAG